MDVHIKVAKKTAKVIAQFILVFGLVAGMMYLTAGFCQWRVEQNEILIERRG